MKKYLMLLMVMVCFIGLKNVYAEKVNYSMGVNIADINEYVRLDDENEEKTSAISSKSPCIKLKSPLKFIGYIILIVKIIIPLLLIIFGIIDLFKAVTGGKDGEVAKSLKTFVFRLIAGVAIFFIPTIISFVFTLVDGFDDVENEYELCQKCILNVSSCN